MKQVIKTTVRLSPHQQLHQLHQIMQILGATIMETRRSPKNGEIAMIAVIASRKDSVLSRPAGGDLSIPSLYKRACCSSSACSPSPTLDKYITNTALNVYH
ncbi:hypothetical protein SLA2020_350200 [Shorea laevis]